MARLTRILAVSLLTVAFYGNFCEGEKILFFFIGGSYSHKSAAWPWASELSNRGHEVTFISPFEKKPWSNSNLTDLASTTLYQLMSSSYDVDRFQNRRDEKERNFLKGYSKISIDICETTLLKSRNDPVIQKLLLKKGQKFDLVVVNIIFGECGWAIAHQFGAKTIGFDASVVLPWFPDIYGFHADASWIPDLVEKYDNIPFSFLERMKNTIRPIYWYYDRLFLMYPALEKITKKAYNMDKVPPYMELEQSASLIFVNSHPGADFAYSLPPSFIQVGGMQTYLPEKAIPDIYQDFMDNAGPAGVVLISFGSTIRLEKVPLHYKKVFFELIRKHKDVRFLMRWSGPLLEGYEDGMDNLLASDWLPQRELLRHPNLRAFMTHGGLNSVQEATYYGVPLIVLPLFADQDYNAYRVDAQNVGFRLEIRDLDFPMMDKALTSILSDTKYKNNMEIKSKIFRDRQQNPLESAIFWTEFVLRNDDTSSLKPMNRHQNWIQRRLLDVYAALAAIILAAFMTAYFVITKMIKIVFSPPNHISSMKVKVKHS